MARLIFEPPASRSEKTIGTSTTLKPALRARYVVSIWKAYPLVEIRSSPIASSTLRRKHLKPPVRSRTGTPRSARAYRDPNRLTARRPSPQLRVAPPST
jgi:hypothetical protein